MDISNNYLEALRLYNLLKNKKLTFTSPPVSGGGSDVTPSTLNWGNLEIDINDLAGSTMFSAVQQILAITDSIILGVSYDVSEFNNKIYYGIASNNIPFTTLTGMTAIATTGKTFSVALDQYVSFGLTGTAVLNSEVPATVRIFNVSDNDASLDTFTVSVFDSYEPTGAQLLTSGLVLHFDANDTTSYPGTGKTWYNIASGYGIGSGGETYHLGFTYNSASAIQYIKPGDADFTSFAKGVTSFALNKSSQGIMRIPDGDGRLSILNPGNADYKTIQMWYYPYTTAFATKGIFAKRFLGSTDDGFRLQYGSTWSGSGLSAQFEYELDGETNVSPSSTTFNGNITNLGVSGPIGASAWQFVTMLVGYTAGANQAIKLYVNGITVGTATYNLQPLPDPDVGSTAAFTVGQYGATYGDVLYGDYGPFMIGALYFYDKGLTVGDILNNYNATKTRYGY